MPSSLVIDVAGPVPAFEQIRSYVAGAIAEGRFQPGDQLPAARTLAADLGVAVGTVGRAYRELTAAGLTSSKPRYGTVVASDARSPVPADVRAAAARLAVRARAASVPLDDVIDLVRAAMPSER